jgi:hypothetical protein
MGGALLDSTGMQLDLSRMLLTHLSESDGERIYGIAWTETILNELAIRLTQLGKARFTQQEARNEIERMDNMFPAAKLDERRVNSEEVRLFPGHEMFRQVRKGLFNFDKYESSCLRYLIAASVVGDCDRVVTTRLGLAPGLREFEPTWPGFITPDEFLIEVADRAARKIRKSLRRIRGEGYYGSMAAMLDSMRKCGLGGFAETLGDMRDLSN